VTQKHKTKGLTNQLKAINIQMTRLVNLSKRSWNNILWKRLAVPVIQTVLYLLNVSQMSN